VRLGCTIAIEGHEQMRLISFNSCVWAHFLFPLCEVGTKYTLNKLVYMLTLEGIDHQ